MANQKTPKAQPVAAQADDKVSDQALTVGKLVQATVAPDGAIAVKEALSALKLVDIADVDLLLTFANGDHVIISNGALDALSPNPPDAIFNDRRISLQDLFKLVGVANPSKAGSLRLVSENIDANPPQEEIAQQTERLPDMPPPAPLVKVGVGTSTGVGKGPGNGLGAGGGEGEVPATVMPLVTPQPAVFRSAQKPSVPVQDLLSGIGLGSPSLTTELYTSSVFKVAPSGRSDLPLGAYDPNASTAQLADRISPLSQSTREIINGTSGADTIDFNPGFSIADGQWSKTLHLTIDNFSDLTSIQLVFNATGIGQISGFDIKGIGGVVVTRDSPTSNSWHVTPTADMLLNGADVAIVYNVIDSAAAPVDFAADVIVDGHAGPYAFQITNNLTFTWRDALTEADFTVTSTTGAPLLVLPRAGVGVEVLAGDGNDIVNTGAGADILRGGIGNDTLDGGLGNDILDGGLGADVMDGGDGRDTATYETATIGVTARLDTGGVGNAGLDAVGDSYANIENLTGSNFDDILIGTGSGNILTGGAGNDKLVGKGGVDTLDGGIGVDTVSYEFETAGITASLTSNTGRGGLDTFISIENLTGGAGNDTFIGAAGIQANAFDGGAGTSDTVSYATSTNISGVVASLTAGLSGVSQTNDADGDTFVNIENLTGTDFVDTLIGDGAVNILTGGLGDDVLEGLGGGDSFVGGAGADTVSYAHSTAVAGVGVVASLTGGLSGVVVTNDAVGDSYDNIENMVGTAFNDTLIGNSANNVLTGGDGNDVLEGMDGADTLIGGAGTNTASYEHSNINITVSLTSNTSSEGDILSNIQNLIGGSGNDTFTGAAGVGIANTFDGRGGSDTVSYATSSNTGGVVASLTAIFASDPTFIQTNDALNDSFYSIENLTGTNYADILIGDGAVNILNGGQGNDVLEGLGGGDSFVGGVGNDTVSYAHSVAVAGVGVVASLTTSFASDPTFTQTNDALNDIFDGIDNLTGSDFADTLIGDAAANILTGAAGDDVLEGLSGADNFIGGSGTDTVSYAHSAALLGLGVVASMTTFTTNPVTLTGDAVGDSYDSIENMIGTDYNDTLIGNSFANNIAGGLGDDIFEGVGGGDTYNGGAGNNTVSYAHAADVGAGVGVTASLLTPSDPTGNQGAAAGDIYSNIQNITGSDFNDTLEGDANNNILTGGAGDDLLTGGLGVDVLYGGFGDDILADDGIGAAKLYGNDGDDIFKIGIVTNDVIADVIDGGDKSALRSAGIYTGAGDTIELTKAGTQTFTIDMSSLSTLSALTAQFTHNLAIPGSATTGFTNIENFTVTGTNLINITLDNYSNTIDATSNGNAIDVVNYKFALGSIDVNLSSWAAPNVTGGSSVLDNFNSATNTWTGIGDTLKSIERIEQGSNYADNIVGRDVAGSWLAGGLGADYINGGGLNSDGVYLDPGRSQTVVASLLTATQNSSMNIVMTDTAQGDVYVNVENLYSSGIDQLYGNASSNMLYSNGTMEGFVGADVLTSLNNAAATASYTNAGNAYLAGQGITTAASQGVTANLTNPSGTAFTSGFAGASATSGLGVSVANTGDALGDTYVNNMYGLTGSAFDDILIGNALNNTITGGAGNDLMEGLAGADSFKGGLGIDAVSYAHSTAGIVMDLGNSGLYNAAIIARGTSDAAVVAGGVITAIDAYTDVENVIGSTFNDTLAGNSLDNVLNGGAGNDLLDGGAHTASGFDIASYAYTNGAVTVNLNTLTAQNTVSAGSDTLTNIQGLIGSDFNDTLTGDGSANWIDGGLGADTLVGGGGIDTLAYSSATGSVTVVLNGSNSQGDTLSGFENLLGSLNPDSLTGDSANNVIEGDLGDDILIGGGNSGGVGDTVSYSRATSSVTVNLSQTSPQDTIAAGLDTISGFNSLTGSDYNDILTGDLSANVISGGQGDDFLIGSTGGDTLAGGSGKDTVSYVNSGSVTVTINGFATHDSVTDTLIGIENLIGSINADHITGDANDNIIDGGLGDDIILGGSNGTVGDTISYASAAALVTVNFNSPGPNVSGGAGNDTITLFENIIGSIYNDNLTGDGGDNVIEGGAGNDVMDGGANGASGDTASYNMALSSITVSLLVVNVLQNTGGAGSDKLSNFENLLGSAYNDILTGTGAVNILNGGAGDDTLVGGGSGDTLIGGAGIDTISYAGSTGVTVNLNLVTAQTSAATTVAGLTYGGAGDAQNDIISGVENITGSGSTDFLTGDANNNVIDGGAERDLMYGGNGNDKIYANLGNDIAYGENNNDTFYVSSLTGNLPTIIDGGARDAGNIQNHGGNVMVLQDLVNGGSYNMTALASLNTRLVNIDTLNIYDGKSTAITMSSQDIQNMVDGGNASQVYVEANNGDSLNVSLAAGQTMAVSSIVSSANSSTYTDYTIFNSSMVQVAQVHWHATA